MKISTIEAMARNELNIPDGIKILVTIESRKKCFIEESGTFYQNKEVTVLNYKVRYTLNNKQHSSTIKILDNSFL